MKKIIFISLAFFSCATQYKEPYAVEKRQIYNIIEQVDDIYTQKKKNINQFFTSVIQCTACNLENGYESEYMLSNKDFVENNLPEMMGFLDKEKVKASMSSLKKTDNVFTIFYQTVKVNDSTSFEGASVIISFKKEDGVFKIYAIETIP